MEVPSEVLPKLVCENCDGYLSRGPVHLMDNVRYRCGRCLPSEEELGTRIEVYEELAKLMTFPCRYQHNGCTSKVPFVENEVHEEACPYRKYICPIADSGQCEWTGIQTELLEHCQQDHPDNVVENPCKFTHNITRSSLHNYLLWALGVLFLIQTKVCTVTRKIYHSVRLLGDPAGASSYKYTLCIQNKDSNFSKHREVAPRGCLALQNDSSIQTDINGLLTMLEDFTGTTFTVTVESTGHGTTEVLTPESTSRRTSRANTRNTIPVRTLEIAANRTTRKSSTAESSSQRTSSANTPNTTSVEATEVRVECAECKTQTEPVYRGGWLCTDHAPKQRWCGYGCWYSDLANKFQTHKSRFCKHRTQCEMCSADITSETRDVHYTQTHADIIHRAGTVCTVSPVNAEHEFWITGYDFGRVVCTYKLLNSDFALYVYTRLLSTQLYKYKCTVDISHPVTGHTLQCVPTVGYDTEYDWCVQIARSDFNKYSQNNKVNIKISVSKIEDPSEFIL